MSIELTFKYKDSTYFRASLAALNAAFSSSLFYSFLFLIPSCDDDDSNERVATYVVTNGNDEGMISLL